MNATTAPAADILPELARATAGLQSRATFLHAMAEAADSLFDDMPHRTPSGHSNGLNAVLSSLIEQAGSLANDLDRLEKAIRDASKGGAQ